MKFERAVSVLKESLDRPSSTYCSPGCDREEYIAEQKSLLQECVIQPREVTAVACKWAQEHCNADGQEHRLVAIAKHKETWLLFDPSRELFLVAQGSMDSQPLEMTHGMFLASADALAEWLG